MSESPTLRTITFGLILHSTRAAKATGTARRRGCPGGTGARAREALAHVHKRLEVTIAELAKRMKITS